MSAKIALVDCDSFFVSCEQAENTSLQNKAVCVVSGENGCVVSRSKAAKQLGVKMGQPCFMAKKEFPNVYYINSRHELYRNYSQKVMACLKSFTPDVEICSIDEAYMNLHGLDNLYHKDFFQLAQSIRQKIFQECKIPVSIGISSSKLLAKLASDKAKKQDGVYIINQADLPKILADTCLEDVCGFGRQHTAKMKMRGIFNCSEFVEQSDSWIRQSLGIVGLDLKYELLGHLINKVQAKQNLPKSIQNTAALSKFTTDETILRASLKYHVHCAGRKLRSYNCFCQTVGIMLRTKDFRVYTDYLKLSQPTNGENAIFLAVQQLLKKIYIPNVVYRSSGIMLEHLQSQNDFQPNLFAEPDYIDDKISRVMDELEKKFGKNIIKNGLF